MMHDATSPLLTDLYQLNMIQAYLDHGQTGTAVFEFFVRAVPSRRQFLMAAGLEQALDFLQDLRFSADDLDWLSRSGRFGKAMIDYLAGLRFTGEVHAMPEGTVFFANEPILRVTAPLPQAQLLETRLVNLLHFQTLIASKAARSVLAAPGRLLVDFGLRRAHGAEAGIMAARASYVAGFAGTATVLAGKLFDIPIYGTMAHSFVQSYDDEAAAFEAFAVSRPEGLTLLIDTYDTEAGARKVVALAPRLKSRGITVQAVRLDSGDLLALSRAVRGILDDGGLKAIRIFASGGLDEERVAALLRAGAPIDGFGIGTSLTTSSDAPTLDCVYKLEEYAGLPRRNHGWQHGRRHHAREAEGAAEGGELSAVPAFVPDGELCGVDGVADPVGHLLGLGERVLGRGEGLLEAGHALVVELHGFGERGVISGAGGGLGLSAVGCFELGIDGGLAVENAGEPVVGDAEVPDGPEGVVVAGRVLMGELVRGPVGDELLVDAGGEVECLQQRGQVHAGIKLFQGRLEREVLQLLVFQLLAQAVEFLEPVIDDRLDVLAEELMGLKALDQGERCERAQGRSGEGATIHLGHGRSLSKQGREATRSA